MTGKKGKSGGARYGTGKKTLYKKNTNKRICISNQTDELLTEYSEHLKISKPDLVNILCLLYLDKTNKDIIHCEKCGKPLFFQQFKKSL